MVERISRTEQQARTRQRLLGEGARIFAARGFAAATVEEITAAAGVTRGALYKHFDGKEGLFLALANGVGEEQLARWSADESSARTDEEHLDALAGLVDRADLNLGLASLEFLAHIRSRPHFRDQAIELQRDVDRRVAELLRRTCLALGVEPSVPLEDLVPLVSAVANGLALRSCLDDGVDVARAFRVGLVALLTGTAHVLPARAVPARRPARSSRT